MDHLLGMHFTSIWWAFLYLMILCIAATILDRVIGRLVGKVIKGGAAKAARLVLMSVACAIVLWVADLLMDGVLLNWWTLVGFAVLAAVLMVVPENDKPVAPEQ